jgi:hypothetical protein
LCVGMVCIVSDGTSFVYLGFKDAMLCFGWDVFWVFRMVCIVLYVISVV